ncbi:signal peptide peptidase SppA [Asticcacaulis sp. EMRT-3]|uniref:signal peptide peptidase SppA n=1 Tax=Asticcacaulis sp. EMRT-3 TaxID=3040349 RepID=UPI0024AECC64|nr:signal peptide peptidase SppA [Asticcacaulis sp. EMRT-3]MDI7774449.1 signal peptide peptidase SppA [Asticcacaulis sp. EMRT-3]
MKQFFITFSAVVLAMLFVLVGVPVAVVSMIAAASHPKVSGDVVLSLDLRQKMTDQSTHQPLDFLTGGGLSTMDVVTTLHSAADDPHVKAVFVRLPEGGISPAAAEEIRDAFAYMRKANKPVIAHSQGLYPDTMVVASYMLGASASELWMQPRASFQVTGISTSTMFLKRAFDKYGVKAEYEQRYEFKNAVNPYLYDNYTPAHREATLGWMNGIYNDMLGDIAHDRRMDPVKLRATLEAGPYGAEQAMQLKLVDHLGQVQDAENAALKHGDNAKLMDIDDYEKTLKPASGQTIALINGEGAIMTGKGGSGLGGNPQMLSDNVSDAFFAAAKDKNVKAIIFRLSSPGGSDTASEQIASAMKAAKLAGKPVVVSMGDYAASGGYWISAGASAIVANPSTLTGSIGVFGGKFAYGDALSRFGVDLRDISVGSPYSQAYSPAQGFTPAQRAALSGWIDQIYNGFVTHVAEGRNLPEATVRDIARGRVWTGAQAAGLHLVDKVGGFYDAVDTAKSLAHIDAGAAVKLVDYDTQTSLFGKGRQGIQMSLSGFKALSFLGWAMTDPKAEAMMNQMADERLREDGATVMAPPAYQTSGR